MQRIIWVAAFMTAVALTGTAVAVDGVWDGGDGEWDSSNWNAGSSPFDLWGSWRGLREPGDTATISSGNVTYNHESLLPPEFPEDFQVYQGTAITINNGASLTLFSDEFMGENWWTEFDLSNLTLDNGSLHKVGEVGIEGGGAFILGSWKGDDNYPPRDPSFPPPETININMTNNSTWTNVGQVWFGSAGDNPPGLVVNVRINEGTMDFTGGDTATLDNDGVLLIDQDVVFHYGWNNDDNVPNGEKYNIDFTGPGTWVVDNGIIAPVQDGSGFWDFNVIGGSGLDLMRYEDLWNAGILQIAGVSGLHKGESAFNWFFSTSGTSGAADYTLTSTVPNTPIVWDGGDGNWNDANWNTGQTAEAVMGRRDGWELSQNIIGTSVTISSGVVTYNANENDPVNPGYGDFRFVGGTLNITSGATLRMDTTDDTPDGYWTEFDGQLLNIAGGTFDRGFEGTNGALTAGPIMFGSWKSEANQRIDVRITDGGHFINDGQVWFGTPSSSEPGLTVVMTIDDGHVDLTGGNSLPGGMTNDDVLFIDADLTFTYNWDVDNNVPSDETYIINFIGSGDITVDNGIIAPVQDGAGFWDFNILGNAGTDLLSYEDLWGLGILKANGLSGLDGADFDTFFMTEGASGSENYKLISLIVDVFEADFNVDGKVDGDDFLLWQEGFGIQSDAVKMDGDYNNDGKVDGDDFLGWQAEFGEGVNGAGSSAVPEPASAVLACLAALAVACLTRRRMA